MRQQVRACHAAGNRTAWRGLLHHLFAATTGLLDPGDLHHLHLGRDHVQQFADILAHRTKGASLNMHASGVMRKSPPQSGQQVPGSSSRRSRRVPSETRGRRRSAGAEGFSGDGSFCPSSMGASSPSATATSRSSSASSSCSTARQGIA